MALWSVASPLISPKPLLSHNNAPLHLLPSMSLKQTRLVLSCTAPQSTSSSSPAIKTAAPPILKKRIRYRKQYPGESKGITEEMRFVAMKLRNIKGRYVSDSGSENSSAEDSEKDEERESEVSEKNEEEESEVSEKDEEKENEVSSSDGNGDEVEGEDWKPSMKGFLKHLVDSKLVFETVEHIVDASDDVAYVYFRKTGLERSEVLSKDLEWFRQQDIEIPEPSNPGVSYSKYLEKIAEKSAPLFLCHFYNIYFSHIAGGQVIAKQVSDKLLDGRELEFCQWEGDVSESLRRVRDNLNKLGEHWARDVKNKALNETKKSFRYLGEIVRLIIL